MAPILLTDSDKKQLKEIIHQVRSLPQNPRNRPAVVEPDHNAPDVYVARTPSGGIPAMTRGPFPTGTGSGTADYDDPGQAECEIHQLVNFTDPVTGLQDGDLIDVQFTRTVWNISDSPIPGNSWILAVRDKFGVWFAPPIAPASSVPGLTVQNDGGAFKILNVNTLTFLSQWLSIDATAPGVATIGANSPTVVDDHGGGGPSPISRFTFSSDTGDYVFTVTNSGNTSDIYLAPASDTQAGYVTINGQTFAGPKTFSAGFVTISNPMDPHGYFQALYVDFDSTNPQFALNLVTSDTVVQAAITFVVDVAGTTTAYLTSSATNGSAYGCDIYQGLTGFILPGAKAYGGLVVDLGGGMGSPPTPVSSGGTGQTSLTIYGLLVGEGTSPVNSVVLGDAQILVGQTSADPTAVTVGGDLTMVDTGAFTVAALQTYPLALSSPSMGDVITWSGSAWVNAPGGSGSLAIGDAVGNGIANYLLFTDPSGNLGQSSSLQWNDTSKTFTLVGGGSNPLLETTQGSYAATLCALGTTTAAVLATDGTRTVAVCDGTNAVTYVAGNSGNWASSSPPTDVWLALDRIAAALAGLLSPP